MRSAVAPTTLVTNSGTRQLGVTSVAADENSLIVNWETIDSTTGDVAFERAPDPTLGGAGSGGEICPILPLGGASPAANHTQGDLNRELSEPAWMQNVNISY